MEKEHRCCLSDPAHPHTLEDIGVNASSRSCFTCREGKLVTAYTPHYYCKTCDVEFHDDCHKRPRMIRHPYHLQHPLTLVKQNLDDTVSNKCDWCKRSLHMDTEFYRCSICSFTLDCYCSKDHPPLTITNPKCHQHPLLFFPRPLLLPCDACGLVKEDDPSYACFQCNYMVHRYCMDLPRVIKITRHPHRLSHTPYLPSLVDPSPLCRICYKEVDKKHGSYSCNLQEGCSYVVHSRCATYGQVWDGEELEWEPEEPDEDVESFKKISDGLIKYFCHEHHLKYDDVVQGAEKQCEACVLPIISGHFYNCIQCDFALHEVCAGLPRKLDHAMHKHTLVLDTSPVETYFDMHCNACRRRCTGFRYKCSDKYCASSSPFNIDFQCISIAEYLTHRSHDHPLFMVNIYFLFDADVFCNHCKAPCTWAHLQCTLCEFSMCFTCATTPHEVFYKFDKHPLSLCYGEEDCTYWCEVCEGKINPKEWFYTCNKCCPTIHVRCLFGSNIYIKPGSSFEYHSTKVETIRNGKTTRPLCLVCGNHCPDAIYFVVEFWSGGGICSFNCLDAIVEWYENQQWFERQRKFYEERSELLIYGQDT